MTIDYFEMLCARLKESEDGEDPMRVYPNEWDNVAARLRRAEAEIARLKEHLQWIHDKSYEDNGIVAQLICRQCKIALTEKP